jgi:hypothetical protein
LHEAWDSAKKAMIHAQSLWQKPTSFRPYCKGERVWLEGTNLHTSHLTYKLCPKWFGPFKILEVLSPVTYRLELPPTWCLHNAFHAALLSPYRETSTHGVNYPTPAPKLIEGEPEWKIDKILASQKYRCKRNLQYLIKWVGYPESNNT